jgi:hypothetical protein
MKISFAITVCNELDEIKRLIPLLLEHKGIQDEIVILFDEKNGNKDVLDFILPYNIKPNVQVWRGLDWDNNFADWKNKLNDYCIGDYIFQLDSDETVSEFLIKNIGEIIKENSEVELFYLARINTVSGITMEHINKWRWNLDKEGRINFPDYQGRVYKSNLKWEGKVHEKISGAKYYAVLPLDEEYCIQHHKTIERQNKQNIFYQSI